MKTSPSIRSNVLFDEDEYGNGRVTAIQLHITEYEVAPDGVQPLPMSRARGPREVQTSYNITRADMPPSMTADAQQRFEIHEALYLRNYELAQRAGAELGKKPAEADDVRLREIAELRTKNAMLMNQLDNAYAGTGWTSGERIAAQALAEACLQYFGPPGGQPMATRDERRSWAIRGTPVYQALIEYAAARKR